MQELIDLDLRRHAQELLDSWQARALAGTSGLLNALVRSVLAHNFDDAMPLLMRLVYPEFDGTPPATSFATAGRINHAGRIVADMVDYRTGKITREVVVFRNETHMRDVFRKLADLMKLNDQDRAQLFVAARRWIVADRRLDPTMNPQDPDAKRLVYH